MKNVAIFAIGFILLATQVSKAGDFGLGLILGNPTGFSGKYWLNNKNAVDGALGWHLGDQSVQIHGDYLWHTFDVIKKSSFKFDLYYGIGARFVGPSGKFGVRGPIGLSHEFKNPDIETFVEFALDLNFAPVVGLDADLLLGARYYF